MPQRTLWSTGQEAVGIQVEVEDLTPQLDVAVMTTVRVKRLDGEWTVFCMHRWVGIEADLLDQFVEGVMKAWSYGTVADVLAAATKVKRQAREHRRRHDRLG